VAPTFARLVWEVQRTFDWGTQHEASHAVSARHDESRGITASWRRASGESPPSGVPRAIVRRHAARRS
jgi:hypothetical protein